MKLVHNVKSLVNRRRELRKNSTETEDLLWQKLRGKKLGYKFRRQYSIGGYILDFYCAEKRLIIEVDGLIHEQQREYDDIRDRYFSELDYRVLRFKNSELKEDISKVMLKIKLNIEDVEI